MPLSVGFQIAVEITKLFPPREVLQSAATNLLNLARDFRKAGSDIVIEEDLAEIFGRLRISGQIERSFHEVFEVQNYVPLSDGCEIVLQPGPGPALSVARRQKRYLVTAVQLSLLGWTHNRDLLASMLASAMRKRHESGIPGASPDSGYEAIINTLASISAQSSSFDWSFYTLKVEQKLRLGIPTFQYAANYTRITPALLLGAMDCLFLVQRFPDDRITVSNEIGSITLIVWAHYVLELNVMVTGKVQTPIIFGKDSEIHVTIQWTKENADEAGELLFTQLEDHPGPEIRLLDPNMSVVLKSFPEDDNRRPIEGEDRHILCGWGKVYLERLINTNLITTYTDPIYKDAVNFITALAIHVSDRLSRGKTSSEMSEFDFIPEDPVSDTLVDSELNLISLEYWRILGSARMIFHGITVDDKVVDAHIHYLKQAVLTENDLPNSFDAFLKKVRQGMSRSSPAYRLFLQMKHLARVVLLFAYVADVESCAQMPLRLTCEYGNLGPQIAKICKHPDAKATVTYNDIFDGICDLLFNKNGDVDNQLRRPLSLFLGSDFGWSVFLSTRGDRDPTEVRPELIEVKMGTPTNIKTNERRFLLRDGTGLVRKDYPDSYPTFTGPSYLPRCAAKVSRRQEFWSTNRLDFESTLLFSVKPSPEWCDVLGPENAKPFEATSGFHGMQHALWQTLTTPDDICEHRIEVGAQKHIKLGPDAIALLGWGDQCEYDNPFPHRILIYLTKGDRRLRWLAIATQGHYSIRGSGRQVLLKSSKCCDECALAYVASLPGRWILIL